MNSTVYKSISEVSNILDIAPHTLRFWETKFPYLNPKKVGGSRFYNDDDIVLIERIAHHLKIQGYTIKGVLTIMQEVGIDNLRNNVVATQLQAQEIRKKLPAYDGDILPNESPLPILADTTQLHTPMRSAKIDLTGVKNALMRLKKMRTSL